MLSSSQNPPRALPASLSFPNPETLTLASGRRRTPLLRPFPSSGDHATGFAMSLCPFPSAESNQGARNRPPDPAFPASGRRAPPPIPAPPSLLRPLRPLPCTPGEMPSLPMPLLLPLPLCIVPAPRTCSGRRATARRGSSGDHPEAAPPPARSPRPPPHRGAFHFLNYARNRRISRPQCSSCSSLMSCDVTTGPSCQLIRFEK